ncbi:PUA domain-containing protein [Candidatus Methanomethylophilus sp. 1R26]|uniref:PUA domain-containing protein n=1 Tax=Candidatus Methanomethylophilus sp. 1R26 TaxID=1769296 RepID=UPI00191063A4|nr:PUA domain-containing protein [Candidatus Methanomethylophilus sp. 1R26]
MEPVDYMIDRKETIRSALGFQFGRDVADAIMDGSTYGVGRFPYWKIFRDMPNGGGRIQLGMMSPERGMFSLTMDGARILAGMGRNTVQIQDFPLKGSLFAVGVEKADPSLRIGDEAVIVCNGDVRGVGVAAMCGREMEQLKRGIAVKTRHKLEG